MPAARPLGDIPEEIPAERMYTPKDLAKEWGVSATYVRDRINDGSLGWVDFGTGQMRRPRIPASEARRFYRNRFVAARTA